MASEEQAEEVVAFEKDNAAGMLESDDADEEKMTKSGEEEEVINNESLGPFSVKTWIEDITLEVEGKLMYVSKAMLATVSPVFRKMFDDNVSLERIVLPGKKYEDVLEFLLSVYPNPDTLKKIDENNVMTVVPFIVEYKVVNLLGTCEACIGSILDGIDSIEQLLSFLGKAAAYGLTETKGKCLDLLNKKDVENIEKSKMFDELPQDLKMEVLAFMAKILNEQVKRQQKTIDSQNRVIMNDKQFKEYYLVGFPSRQRAQIALFKTSGSIHLVFAPVSMLKETLTSKPIKCGDSTLQLQVSKYGNYRTGEFLKADLIFTSKEKYFKVKYELVNNFLNKDNLVVEGDGYGKLLHDNSIAIIKWSDLINESEGFIRDGEVKLNAFFTLAE